MFVGDRLGHLQILPIRLLFFYALFIIINLGVPMFDPGREGALVMPRPPVDHPLRNPSLVDVVLDPYVGAKLRKLV